MADSNQADSKQDDWADALANMANGEFAPSEHLHDDGPPHEPAPESVQHPAQQPAQQPVQQTRSVKPAVRPANSRPARGGTPRGSHCACVTAPTGTGASRCTANGSTPCRSASHHTSHYTGHHTVARGAPTGRPTASPIRADPPRRCGSHRRIGSRSGSDQSRRSTDHR